MAALTRTALAFSCIAVAASPVYAAASGIQDVCARPPVVESAVSPLFPDVAHRARLFGTVHIAVKVGDDGTVTAAELPATEGNPMFGNPALAAARRWRFKRAHGCNSRQATLTFDFKKPVPPGRGDAVIFNPPYGVQIVVEEIQVILDSMKAP